jgi:hypothetical protein
MKYDEFKELIHKALISNPDGLTWKELKSKYNLPYETPCQTWLYQMEEEIGLSRERENQRAYTWKISIKKNVD